MMLVVAKPEPLRNGMAILLSTATLAVSIGLPLLEAREPVETVSIEAAHDPGRCLYGHDHLACAQFSSSHAVPVGPSLQPSPALGIERSGVSPREAAPPSGRLDSALPRAPPLIG